jgi:TRAP transporter 4TM/12TM fusion protein
MGMISGSGIGNVATTGVFTIPLMKRMGYVPHIAGGIEAAASSGGQIMPPIMGASAFIMAEFTGTPYIEIIKIAFIPAILYYIMLIFQVHFRAHRRSIPAIPRNELPSIIKILKAGWYLSIPLFILVGLLILQYTPLFAGVYAIVAIMIVSMFRKDTRLDLKKLLSALETGAKNAAPIAMACACAGIVVGVITLTGLGMKFSSMIVSFAGGSLFFGIILVAATAMFLGMGLPVVAAYVVLAVLAAPALAELGAPIVAAHLAVMWFTQTSNITPPVCLAAFTAAAIAKAEPMKTGWSSMRYGIGFYFIPFLFFYSPILLNGKLSDIVLTIITAIIGVIVLSASLEEFFLRRLNVIERIIIGMSGILLVWPDHRVSLIGICITVGSVLWQMKTRVKHIDSAKNATI